MTRYPSIGGCSAADQTPTAPMTEALDQARQKGYTTGLEDGKQEGLEIARGMLSPRLENFSATYANVVAVIPKIAEIMESQVVQLTQVLVERILGQAIELTDQDQELFHTSLGEKIIRCHHLTIRIHPEDAHDIQALAEMIGFDCPNGCEVVSIASDPGQTRGQISMETSGDDIDDDVNDLADPLSEFASSPTDANPEKPV